MARRSANALVTPPERSVQVKAPRVGDDDALDAGWVEDGVTVAWGVPQAARVRTIASNKGRVVIRRYNGGRGRLVPHELAPALPPPEWEGHPGLACPQQGLSTYRCVGGTRTPRPLRRRRRCPAP